jgi:O-antigen ligase
MRINLNQVSFRLCLILIVLIPILSDFFSDALIICISFLSLFNIVVLLIGWSESMKERMQVRYLTFILPFICFCFYLIIILLANDVNAAALKVVIQTISVICLIGYSYIYPWTKRDLSFIIYVIVLLLVSYAGYGIIYGFGHTYKAYYAHPNILGSLNLCFMLFILMKKFKNRFYKWLLILSAFFMILISGSRNSFVSLIYAFCTIFAWNYLIKKKHRFYGALAVTLLVISIITIVYPSMLQWNSGMRLNTLTKEITDKNLFSGRQIIWSYLLDAIYMKPWFGYGLNTLPVSFFDTNYSSHNLYLQITLQTGILGLGLFLTSIFFIWKRLWNYRYQRVARLSAGFFLAILLHQSFEVSLTQNNLGVGMLMWIIMTIATQTGLAEWELGDLRLSGLIEILTGKIKTVEVQIK